MSQRNNLSIKWIFSIIILALASVSFAWVYYQNGSAPKLTAGEVEVNVDDKAKKILIEMSNSLKNLKEFSFQSKGYFEIVDSTGKKEKMNNSGEVFVKRPNKIKVLRTGEKSDIELYCDGKQITLYGKKTKYYATSPAASTLDETFDIINQKLDIQLPGVDLLYTDVYEGLMQDIISGKYMGKAEAGNVKCDHLSFTGKEVDWQIWVEEGGMKLPKKYVITSKNIEGKPQASIEIIQWKPTEKLDDKMFTFTPPKGAEKIEFLQDKTNGHAKNK